MVRHVLFQACRSASSSPTMSPVSAVPWLRLAVGKWNPLTWFHSKSVETEIYGIWTIKKFQQLGLRRQVWVVVTSSTPKWEHFGFMIAGNLGLYLVEDGGCQPEEKNGKLHTLRAKYIEPQVLGLGGLGLRLIWGSNLGTTSDIDLERLCCLVKLSIIFWRPGLR